MNASMQQTIEIGSQKNQSKFALFNLGFRPFFLSAGVFSIITLTVWLLIYKGTLHYGIQSVPATLWHAHEMLFGFAFAVIAGFLLTAVKNWTGIQTLHGKPLLALLSLWLLARICMLYVSHYSLALPLAATFDLAFNVLLIIAIAKPILQVNQKRQLGIVAKLLLITIGNSLFYAQVMGFSNSTARPAIVIGLFLIISLILVISRRVVPMFIERGVQEQVVLKQVNALDISIMLLLLTLLLNTLFFQINNVAIITGLLLFAANSIRLINWHTKGIWQAPLLWSLYASLWLITLGFLFVALSFTTPAINIIYAYHLWGIGGIGLITASMMSRVSLGHTGRNIKNPPIFMKYAFALLVLSALIRSIAPIFMPQLYSRWVEIASLFWILAFGIFVVNYFAILTKPRADGLSG
jgi:uncharacterized protein involved in response to NO